MTRMIHDAKTGLVVDVAAVIAAAEKKYGVFYNNTRAHAHLGVRKTGDCCCEENMPVALFFVWLAELGSNESSKKMKNKDKQFYKKRALEYKEVAEALRDHDKIITSGKEGMKYNRASPSPSSLSFYLLLLNRQDQRDRQEKGRIDRQLPQSW
jgi:hypothetical protein